MVASLRCFLHSPNFRCAYFSVSVRYRTSHSRHIPAVRAEVFRRSGRGLDVVPAKWLLLVAESIPIPHLSKYQNAKSPFSETAFPPATTTSGCLIPTNCMVHKKKGTVEETIPGMVPGIWNQPSWVIHFAYIIHINSGAWQKQLGKWPYMGCVIRNLLSPLILLWLKIGKHRIKEGCLLNTSMKPDLLKDLVVVENFRELFLC